MHTIRLRRPWEKCLVGADGKPCAESPSHRVDVPETPNADLAQASSQRSFYYRRKFNRPTGLSESSKLSLKITGWDGALLSVSINQHELSVDGDRIDAEITDRVEPANQLELILCDTKSQRALLSGNVTLEIDE